MLPPRRPTPRPCGWFGARFSGHRRRISEAAELTPALRLRARLDPPICPTCAPSQAPSFRFASARRGGAEGPEPALPSSASGAVAAWTFRPADLPRDLDGSARAGLVSSAGADAGIVVSWAPCGPSVSPALRPTSPDAGEPGDGGSAVSVTFARVRNRLDALSGFSGSPAFCLMPRRVRTGRMVPVRRGLSAIAYPDDGFRSGFSSANYSPDCALATGGLRSGGSPPSGLPGSLSARTSVADWLLQRRTTPQQSCGGRSVRRWRLSHPPRGDRSAAAAP